MGSRHDRVSETGVKTRRESFTLSNDHGIEFAKDHRRVMNSEMLGYFSHPISKIFFVAFGSSE